MPRTATNVIYTAFLILMAIVIPCLLLFGTNGSFEGIIAAILSFGVLASYIAFTLLLGGRNS